MSNPLKHWTAVLPFRRKIEEALRHRLIAHLKAGDKAPRLRRAYERWKGLVAQAERGLARARRTERIFMFDDVDPNLIPRGAKYIAAYIDGIRTSGNFSLVRKLFPHADISTITVTGAHVADIGDCEAGDMRPTSVARWAHWMIGLGRIPKPYASRSEMPAVITELRALGIKRSQVRLFVADYTGKPHLPVLRWGNGLTTADACQYTDSANGESLDESVCLLRFFD